MSDFRLSRRCLVESGLGAASLFLGLGARPCRALSAPEPTRSRTASAMILLWMNGGPSHLETFDPKPGRPEGGPFAVRDTPVAGLRVSEHLGKTAEMARHLAVIRSLTSREGDHDRAYRYLHSGRRPSPALDYPGIGSVVSRERESASIHRLRSFQLLPPGVPMGAGYLGAAHAPLLVVDPRKPLEGWFPHGLEPAVLEGRFAKLAALEALGSAATQGGKLEAEHRVVQGQVRDFLGSSLVKALSLEDEPATVRERYGRGAFGQGCLLARRLVEAGVPFVEVALDGWDSHIDNFGAHARLLSEFDPAYGALLADLDSRGLLSETLVVWMGEFGRTPEINPQRGRDHHSAVFSAVLAGGGVRGGQVIGASDAAGRTVADRPVTVPDLLATCYQAMGISTTSVYSTPLGRPVAILEEGKAVEGMLG